MTAVTPAVLVALLVLLPLLSAWFGADSRPDVADRPDGWVGHRG